MSGRRKSDAAWSARFSTQLRRPGGAFEAHPAGTAGTDDEFSRGLWGAERIRFAWRHGGRSATRTFKLPGEVDDAVSFRRTLALAIADDWAADDRGQPIRPGSEPSPEPKAEAVDRTVLAFRPRSSTQKGDVGGASVTAFPTAPSTAPQPETGLFAPVREDLWSDVVETVSHLDDFEALCSWRMEDLEATVSKRGKRRAGSTLGNAETELLLAADFFRYLPGDPRLDGDVITANTPLRLDDPDGRGLNTDDCRAFVRQRMNVNLTTRAANFHAEKEWVRQIEAAERGAAYPGAPVDLPAAPTPKIEVAAPRTVKATCSTVRAALIAAQAEGRILLNPWTPLVDKLLEKPAPTHFSDKRVFSADHVDALADAVASMRRYGPFRDGKQELQDGDRYRGMIELDYAAFLRPEEIRAARLSWLHLTGPNPGVLVSCAEVNYPLRFTTSPTSRVTVTLKQRNQGDTRWVPLTRTQADALQRHIDQFVPKPNLVSPDLDAQDPRLFTTHGGAPVDLGTFSENWFKPALAAVFPAAGQGDLRNLSFRHLRHSGITRELQAGQHIEDVATWAGNSPLVIKTSYRGVIDRLGPASPTRPSEKASPADAISEIGREVIGLSDDDAAAHLEQKLPSLPPELGLAAGRALARSAKKRIEQEEI